jgi:hypothetical protein
VVLDARDHLPAHRDEVERDALGGVLGLTREQRTRLDDCIMSVIPVLLSLAPEAAAPAYGGDRLITYPHGGLRRWPA